MIIEIQKTKDKEKFLKADRKKHLTYREKTSRMTADFSSETTESRSSTIFQMLNKKNYRPRILYPEKKIALRNKKQI